MYNKLFGYSLKGQNINISSNNKQNINTFVIMALLIDGIVNHYINTISINSDIFYGFIDEIIKKLNDKDYVFIIDNVAFHKVKKTLDLIKEKGHKYIFTLPI